MLNNESIKAGFDNGKPYYRQTLQWTTKGHRKWQPQNVSKNDHEKKNLDSRLETQPEENASNNMRQSYIAETRQNSRYQQSNNTLLSTLYV